jgi:hypothetical protein
VTEHTRAQLLAMLRSPDPAERDDVAYVALTRRIAGGAEDGALVELGDELAQRLTDPEIQARTFAALLLGEVVARDTQTGRATAEAVLRWRDAFARWYPDEKDLRGWDEQLGWLHAVAHGADALAAFGRSPRLRPDDLVALLDTARARLLADTDYVLRDQEDDRLGYALALVLARQELCEDDSIGWLIPIVTTFNEGKPGPVPAFATNAMRTLRMLYTLCDRGFLPQDATKGDAVPVATVAHPLALKDALAGALRIVWPYLG